MPGLLIFALIIQDTPLTEANIDDFLRGRVAEVSASLPRDDGFGNSLSAMSLSGRTVTQEWRSEAPLTLEGLNRLKQVTLMGCEDDVVQAAVSLGVRIRSTYAHGDGHRHVFEQNAETCGRLRVDSSSQWRTLQSTKTRLHAVDVATIVEDGEIRWFELADARPATDENEPAFRRYGYRLDCSEGTFASQYVTAYDRQGQDLDHDDAPRPASRFNPGTVMEAAARGVCEGHWTDRTYRDLGTLLQRAWATFDDASG